MLRMQQLAMAPIAQTSPETRPGETTQNTEGGWLKHWSKPAWLPRGDHAPPNPRTPQPKVGTLEPIKVQGVNCVQAPDAAPPGLELQPPTSIQAETVEVKAPSLNSMPAKVKQDSGSDSEMSDIEDDVQVLIGGHDEANAWRYTKDDGNGQWSRVPGSMEAVLRLSDILALPRNPAGEIMSFGSLGHVLNKDPCKVCVFYRKNSCRHSWLCTFCHSAHQPYVRTRRQQKRPTMRGVHSGYNDTSDSQSMVSSGTVMSDSSTRDSILSAVSQQAEPWYVHLAKDFSEPANFSTRQRPAQSTASTGSSQNLGELPRRKPSTAKLPLQDVVQQFNSPRAN